MSEILDKMKHSVPIAILTGALSVTAFNGCASSASETMRFEVVCPERTDLIARDTTVLSTIELSCASERLNTEDSIDYFPPIRVSSQSSNGDSDLNRFLLEFDVNYTDQPGSEFLNLFNFSWEIADEPEQGDLVTKNDDKKAFIHIPNTAFTNVTVTESE